MAIDSVVPRRLLGRFDVFDWRNAAAVLAAVHPKEWSEIIEVLDGFILKWSIVASKGGPKTDVAKALDAALYARGWTERKFDTKIVVDDDEYPSPTHKVDCF